MARSSTSFGPGNLAAVRHGSRSPRLQLVKRQVISARVRRELGKGSRKWLDDLIVALRARIESYNAYLDRVGGPLSYRGQERQCVDRLRRDESLLLRLMAIRENRPEPASDLAAALDAHWRRKQGAD